MKKLKKNISQLPGVNFRQAKVFLFLIVIVIQAPKIHPTLWKGKWCLCYYFTFRLSDFFSITSFIDISTGCSCSFLLIPFAQTHTGSAQFHKSAISAVQFCVNSSHYLQKNPPNPKWVFCTFLHKVFSQWKVWLDTFLTSVLSQELQLCVVYEVFFKGSIICEVLSTRKRELHTLFYKNYYFFEVEFKKPILFSVSKSNNLILSRF